MYALSFLRWLGWRLTLSHEDYWDSYWIVQGLIKSGLNDVVKETLENFMDELENFGFIPNGGRIYCMCLMVFAAFLYSRHLPDLNRSQPPLFIHVSAASIHSTTRSAQ